MMQTAFTPLSASIGGALIGLAALLLFLLNGRIAGISGIVSRLLPPGADWRWRAAFLIGLVAAPLVWLAAGFEAPRDVNPNLPLMAVAGLLTGFGAVYGSGCTSGHGVCGLSRFSVRSLAAVCVFMAAAALTVFVTRHMGG